jgi:hypothetical protein
MTSTLNFIRPIWVFDTLTNITTGQILSHLSAKVLYIKGVGYFLYTFFTPCMTQVHHYVEAGMVHITQTKNSKITVYYNKKI